MAELTPEQQAEILKFYAPQQPPPPPGTPGVGLSLGALQNIQAGIPGAATPAPAPSPAGSAVDVSDPTQAALLAAAKGNVARPDPFAPTGRPVGGAPATAAPAAAPTAAPAPRLGGPAAPKGPSPAERYLSGLEESDKRVQGALGGVSDAASAASSAQEDLGFGTQASQANAIGRLGEIDEQKQAIMQKAAESMARTQAEIKAKIAALPEIKYDDRSTGEKVMGAIAMALGAFGAAMPHSGAAGRNYAAEIITNQINGKVDAQKATLEKEMKKINFMSDQADKDYLRQMAVAEQLDKKKLEQLSIAKMQIDGYAAQAQSKEAQAKLAQVSAGVTAEIEQRTQAMLTRRFNLAQQQANAAAGGGSSAQLDKAYQAYAVDAYKNEKAPMSKAEFAARVFGGAGGAAGGAKGPGGVITDPAQVPEKERPLLVKMPDGTYQKATSPEAARQVQQSRVAFQQIDASLQALIAARKENSGGAWTPTESDRLRGEAAILMSKVGKAYEMGALSGEEAQRVAKLIPQDPSEFNFFWRGDPTKRLEAARETIARDAAKVYEAHGLNAPAGPGAAGPALPYGTPGFKR